MKKWTKSTLSLAIAFVSIQASAQHFSPEIRQDEPVQIKAAQYIYGLETAPICLSFKDGAHTGMTGQRCQEYSKAETDSYMFQRVANGSYLLVANSNSSSDLCVTYRGYEQQVELTPCNNKGKNSDQLWDYRLSKKQIFRSAATDECLDIFKRDSNINSRIGVFRCGDSNNEHQQWDLDYLSNTSTTESSRFDSCQGDSECEKAFDIASRHAPIFYFDKEKLGDGKKGNCFPMDPNEYYHLREGGFRDFSGDMICSRDKRMLEEGRVPISFYFEEHGGKYYINYWVFHGHQQACFGVSGIHRADWERVMVRVDINNPDSMLVTYDVHGVWYTRNSDEGNRQFEYEMDNNFKRPIIYNGKSSNASYYREGGTGGCAVMADYRNKGTGEKYYRWDTKRNLVNLHRIDNPLTKPWMLYPYSWDRWNDSTHDLVGPLWRDEVSRRGYNACKNHSFSDGNDLSCGHSIGASQAYPYTPDFGYKL